MIEVKRGHNRVPWDLRSETVKNVPGLYTWGDLEGHRAPPGTVKRYGIWRVRHFLRRSFQVTP